MKYYHIIQSAGERAVYNTPHKLLRRIRFGTVGQEQGTAESEHFSTFHRPLTFNNDGWMANVHQGHYLSHKKTPLSPLLGKHVTQEPI